LIGRGRRGRLVQVEQCHWVPHVVRELILNQKKNRPRGGCLRFLYGGFFVGWVVH
jgi:hypothetical protein